jgi:hypothetical protein
VFDIGGIDKEAGPDSDQMRSSLENLIMARCYSSFFRELLNSLDWLNVALVHFID